MQPVLSTRFARNNPVIRNNEPLPEEQIMEGAFRVLSGFEAVNGSTEGMKALELKREEQQAFASAALWGAH